MDPEAPAGLALGMKRPDVEALLGPPTLDPPENPWEDDVVRYATQRDGQGGVWMIVYRGGRIFSVVWARVLEAE